MIQYRRPTRRAPPAATSNQPPGSGFPSYDLGKLCAVLAVWLGWQVVSPEPPEPPPAPRLQTISRSTSQSTAGISGPSLFKDLLEQTPEGNGYIDLFYEHAPELIEIHAADPELIWDGHRGAQNWAPAINNLVAGRGDEIVISQKMADVALDWCQRVAAAGSAELAADINAELAKYNDLQDLVGMTADEWGLAIGADPPAAGTGIVNVWTNRSEAPWSLQHDDGVTTGTGRMAMLGIPAGEVMITWGDLRGSLKPTPSVEGQTLEDAGIVEFQGTYDPVTQEIVARYLLGQQTYEADLDTNGDGVVDIADVVFLRE